MILMWKGKVDKGSILEYRGEKLGEVKECISMAPCRYGLKILTTPKGNGFLKNLKETMMLAGEKDYNRVLTIRKG